MVNKKIEEVKKLFEERGRVSYEIAKKELLKEKIRCKPIYDALQYFIEELWHNFHHPTLLSLTCEAVGGNREQVVHIGAALVLLTGAADVHDDIIDKSLTKNSKPTVLGRFGIEIAMLVGDALLLKGYELLHKSCNSLASRQKDIIVQWLKKAFFDLGVAVTKEIYLKGKWDIDPREYLNIVVMKAAIADATARIGALIGGGDQKKITTLGKYGRILGVLTTIRNDFIDILDPEELKNRIRNECIPLPILYAIQDQRTKDKVIDAMSKSEITAESCWKTLEELKGSPSFRKLNNQLKTYLRRGQRLLDVITIKHEIKDKLSQILDTVVEDILP
ncbi:MAG: polyprenyl synthetase family protein [Candidatus Bathyarchaeia archaeon]